MLKTLLQHATYHISGYMEFVAALTSSRFWFMQGLPSIAGTSENVLADSREHMLSPITPQLVQHVRRVRAQVEGQLSRGGVPVQLSMLEPVEAISRMQDGGREYFVKLRARVGSTPSERTNARPELMLIRMVEDTDGSITLTNLLKGKEAEIPFKPFSSGGVQPLSMTSRNGTMSGARQLRPVPITDELKQIAGQVKGHAERVYFGSVHNHFIAYSLQEALTQETAGIAGTNFFIKARVTISKFVLMRINKDANGLISLTHLLKDAAAEGPVHYFEDGVVPVPVARSMFRS